MRKNTKDETEVTFLLEITTVSIYTTLRATSPCKKQGFPKQNFLSNAISFRLPTEEMVFSIGSVLKRKKNHSYKRNAQITQVETKRL